jgi:GNAT superfamily N-acetyltransferase
VTAAVIVERARTVAECASIVGLVDAHVRFENSATILPTDWAERASGLVASARLDIFVAVMEGGPVGYATMTRDVSTWSCAEYAHLDCLYIDDRHRGSGVGLRLIQAVSRHAHDLGLHELQWQTPLGNEGAIRFYNRLGARQSPKARFTLELE